MRFLHQRWAFSNHKDLSYSVTQLPRKESSLKTAVQYDSAVHFIGSFGTSSLASLPIQLFSYRQLNSAVPPRDSFSCPQNGPAFCVSIFVDGIIIFSLAPNRILSHLWLLPPLQVLKSVTSNSEISLTFILLLYLHSFYSLGFTHLSQRLAH